MAKEKTSNGGKPVTRSELNAALNKALKPIIDKLTDHDKRFVAIDKRFVAIDKRFVAIDKRFVGINERFVSIDERFTGIDNRLDGLSRAIVGLGKNMNEKFDKIFNHIDAFMKRTEWEATR